MNSIANGHPKTCYWMISKSCNAGNPRFPRSAALNPPRRLCQRYTIPHWSRSSAISIISLPRNVQRCIMKIITLVRWIFYIKIVWFCIQFLFHGKGIWNRDSCDPRFWRGQIFRDEIFRKNVETLEGSHSRCGYRLPELFYGKFSCSWIQWFDTRLFQCGNRNQNLEPCLHTGVHRRSWILGICRW